MKITQLDQLCESNGKCNPREAEAKIFKPSFVSKTISTAKKIPRECVLKVLLDLERSLYFCVEDESVEKLRRGFHPHDAVDLLLRLLQDRDAA